jgi:hypothetical protein
MVHLDGLYLTLFVGRHKGDLHPFLHDTGLYPSDRNRADTADAVDILDREPEWLVSRFLGFLERVERLKKRGTGIPGCLGAFLCDVDTLEGTGGDKWTQLATLSRA